MVSHYTPQSTVSLPPSPYLSFCPSLALSRIPLSSLRSKSNNHASRVNVTRHKRQTNFLPGFLPANAYIRRPHVSCFLLMKGNL